MQSDAEKHMNELLTTAEAAGYLRLGERKLYELIAAGAIPCTKVTGRWLLPRADLDRWLRLGLVTPEGFQKAEPPSIVGGSHDALIEWALRESGSSLATLPEGSEAGLARFRRREVVAAAIHLHAIAGDDVDANVAAARAQGGADEVVLLALARREQGLVVVAGNPLGLGSIADVITRGARFATRPKGAGAHLLLLALLVAADKGFADLAIADPPCPTGPDIAQAIRAGRADCGIATRNVAHAAGLGFVPLVWERFDLLLRQRDYFRPPMQALLAFVATPAFARRGAELTGYDVADAGQVRYAP